MKNYFSREHSQQSPTCPKNYKTKEHLKGKMLKATLKTLLCRKHSEKQLLIL